MNKTFRSIPWTRSTDSQKSLDSKEWFIHDRINLWRNHSEWFHEPDHNWFIEQIWLKRICSQTGPTHEQNIEMDSVNQIDWFIDQIRLKLMFH